LGARKGYTNRIEVLTLLMVAFLLHGCKTGAKVQNLLTKGSMNHLKHQLTPEQHFSEIAQTITLAKEHNIATNVYLEDWSNGMRNSLNMFSVLDFLATQGETYFTSDTLGF
jgi:D-citramalate synthase